MQVTGLIYPIGDMENYLETSVTMLLIQLRFISIIRS
ncbi:hypothetical protein SAMN05192574_110124 [Mucilaginibacter gossypiicola]|uniref:Uncharacterized protein n=1 Tax=Mucilaginibacter gossypiicola TaxID=551995 RepID=A0A1H8RF05_9SPHI|nr:hypothetical protein SAMN05192574_110124 [Mucilaginibacter gossypiicola]